MKALANGISPQLLQALGWTLLHFVWQGAGLAAFFAVANALCRRTTTRYALALMTLVLMVALPVLTLISLGRQQIPAVRSGAPGLSVRAAMPAQNALALSPSSAPAAAFAAGQPLAMLWLVAAWFLGVVLLSLRTAGGLLVLEGMRRKEIKPVGREFYEKCLALQKKMGLERVIRYCQCLRLDAPAVLGWFRPVVLLPVTALTGLTAEQLEMVIAHELAHIRRFDCFVNLFQVAAETLLFYHPAVWWVSQRVRGERENCCDDEAIAVCGDAVNYARALALMEEWRTAPSLLMAANRSPLSQRIFRLLGFAGAAGRIRVTGLAAGFVCLAGAVLAGNAFLGLAQAALSSTTNVKQDQERSVIVVRPGDPPEAPKRFATTAQGKDKTKDKEKDQQKAGDTEDKKESYLDAMQAAGFKDLTVDQIIAMKIQGVTPAYVKEIHDLGLHPSADEFVGLRVQGITPEYIREMHAIKSNLSVDELIGMKVQGITPQYADEMHALGLKTDPDNLIAMKVQGITPEYIREIQALGLKPEVDELIGMKVQGITPEYVKSMQAEGFKDLDVDQLIGAKVQGVTPEFIEKARKHGFQNLTLDKLIALKQAGVL